MEAEEKLAALQIKVELWSRYLKEIAESCGSPQKEAILEVIKEMEQVNV